VPRSRNQFAPEAGLTGREVRAGGGREEMRASGAAAEWGEADPRRPGVCCKKREPRGRQSRERRKLTSQTGEKWQRIRGGVSGHVGPRIGPVEWMGSAGTLTAAAAAHVRGGGFCLDCRSATATPTLLFPFLLK
jgi:hypothetical protein